MTKVIYNKFIPFKGFVAINLFGILFVRKEYKSRINPIVINHEKIHTEQIKELGYIFFYILYILEWFVKLFLKGNAYRNISFEKEAYNHESDLNYINNRKHFSQWNQQNQ